jgi:hypothetical protein
LHILAAALGEIDMAYTVIRIYDSAAVNIKDESVQGGNWSPSIWER